jgi:hypothetical protein
MPKRSSRHIAVAAPAASTVKVEDDEKSFSLPVQLTKKQCIESFVESVNESADRNSMFWYKHATCAICWDPIDNPSSGVVLDCKHHPFHASCIVKALQRDRRCPVCRHAPASRAEESIQDVANGKGVSLTSESDSDDGIDSDDEEDEYEHYEKLVTSNILAGFDLETLNHCLVCYGCDPERRRRATAKGSRISSSRKRTARIRSEEARITRTGIEGLIGVPLVGIVLSVLWSTQRITSQGRRRGGTRREQEEGKERGGAGAGTMVAAAGT